MGQEHRDRQDAIITYDHDCVREYGVGTNGMLHRYTLLF